MKLSLPSMVVYIGLFVSPAGFLSAEEGLVQRIAKLEAGLAELRAEVTQLKGEQGKGPVEKGDDRQQTLDVRLLMHLAAALEKDPQNGALRRDTAELAKRVAPRFPGRMVWQVLLQTRIIKDGLSLAEAEKVLGPATDKSESRVGWYFNPQGAHVAPYLHAKPTSDGLIEWKISNR